MEIPAYNISLLVLLDLYEHLILTIPNNCNHNLRLPIGGESDLIEMSDSLLSLIKEVDTFPYDGIPPEYYLLYAHDGSTLLGYVYHEIALLMDTESPFQVKHEDKTIAIPAEYDTFEKRNKLMESTASAWRALPQLEQSLDKAWRNELYVVHNPTNTPYMLIERAFSVLIGVVTYGVHMTGYVLPKNTSSGEMKLWIPRRSPTKQTFPNKLDNTVAGGLGYPCGVWETLVKESYEEAGLNKEFVELGAKAVGVLLYMIQPEGTHNQPEVEYIYDLEFPDESTIIPIPVDGEAQDFQLLGVLEVLERIKAHEFKPNCALVIIDFLIRWGYITPENEPSYLEIVHRSHRRFPFPSR